MKPHFLQPRKLEGSEEGDDDFRASDDFGEKRPDLGEFSELHATGEFQDLVGQGNRFFPQNLGAFPRPNQRVLEGEGQIREIHFLPNFLDRGTPIGSTENIFAEPGQLSQAFAGRAETLMLLKLPDELFLGKLNVGFQSDGDVGLVFIGEERLAFPMKESRRHHQELACGIEVQFLHQADVSEVLIGDRRNRDPRNIEFVALDEIKQKIERTFESF